MEMSDDNMHGLVLTLSSSIFIGSSFIIKKKGLEKTSTTGTKAGLGGFSYLYEPWWWAGVSMYGSMHGEVVIREIANFAAYAYAPAILVTPLGALSIIFCAVLAHFILEEKLQEFGVLGCVLCVVGSTSIILHAPKERDIESVKQVWQLATQPGFIVYSCIVVVSVLIPIFRIIPRYGQTHMVVYIGVCSLMGSLMVMSVKAASIALKLTFAGMNQFIYFETWLFMIIVIVFCLTQINCLNKALDTFNTAVVSPDWDSQNASQIVTELCGFIPILSGTFLLHRTKGMGNDSKPKSPIFSPKMVTILSSK